MIAVPRHNRMTTAFVASCSQLVAAMAHADVLWMTPAGGAFSHGANWSTGAMPGSSDTAVFALTSTYPVWAAAPMTSGALRVTAGDISLMLAGGELNLVRPGSSLFEHALRIGSPTDTATLRVFGGPLRSVSSYMSIAWNESSYAEVTGPGASWTNTGELFVGFSGGAALRARQGGVVTAHSAFIGGAFSGAGDVLLSDAGSALVLHGRLVVGAAGLGSLHVEKAGVVAAAYMDVGAISGGEGSAVVRGAGSALQVTRQLTLGGSAFGMKGGSGSLIVEDGGQVLASSIVIAQNDDAQGNLVVRGTGSRAAAEWIAVGSLTAPLASPSALLRVGDGAVLDVEDLELSPHGRVDGLGVIEGRLTSRGIVRPGEETPGALAVHGDYTQVSGPTYYFATSELDIHLAGAPGSPAAGRLLVSGAASLGGRLRVRMAPGFEPQIGQIYEVLSASAILGAFQQVILPERIGFWRARYSADAQRVYVEIIPGGIPGDTNGDCTVNFADLNNVLSQFGQAGFGLIGDVNGDGLVNFQDLNVVLSYFGQSC